MKLAQVLTIAAAAAFFAVPAQAGGGGFSYNADFHVKGGGAKSSGSASGQADAHGDKASVTNHSDFQSYAGEYKGSNCDDCETSSTHEYYAGASANNSIQAQTQGRFDHASVSSSTGVSGSSAIGNLSGGASVSGHH
jgi:hypothetical protein